MQNLKLAWPKAATDKFIALESCRSQVWGASSPAGRRIRLLVFAESFSEGAGVDCAIRCECWCSSWWCDSDITLFCSWGIGYRFQVYVHNQHRSSTCLFWVWFPEDICLRQMCCLHSSVCLSAHLPFFFDSSFWITWIMLTKLSSLY